MACSVRDDCRPDGECGIGIVIAVFSRDSSGTGGILRSGDGLSRHQTVAEYRDVAHPVIFRHGEPFNSRCLDPLLPGRAHRVVESL